MRLSYLIIAGLLLSNIAYAGKLVERDDLNFKVNQARVEAGKIEMSINFMSAEDFRYSEVVEFDTTDLSSNSADQIVFVKSAFIVNRPLSELTHDFFLRTNRVSKVFNAKRINKIGSKSFSVRMKKLGVSIDFKLDIDFQDENTRSTDRLDRLVDAMSSLEPSHTNNEKFMLMTQNRFSRIFKKSITLNRFTPHGNKTLVTSYTIASAKKSTMKKLNAIPFINAEKSLSEQFRGIVTRTHKMLSKN